MNHQILLLISFILLLLSCGKGNDPEKLPKDVKEIMLPALENAGGMSMYQRIDNIRFTKHVKYYRSAGQVEFERYEFHSYDLYPHITGTVKWQDATGVHEKIYSKNYAHQLLNGAAVEIGEERLWREFHRTMASALQPFHLIQKGVTLKREEPTTLASGQLVNVISAQFSTKKQELEGSPDHSEYYFNVNNGKLIAHLDSYNGQFLLNELIETTDRFPIRLNVYTRSWAAEGDRKLRFLRNETWYSEYFMTQVINN